MGRGVEGDSVSFFAEVLDMLFQHVVLTMSVYDWVDQQRHLALGVPVELVLGCMI